MSHRQALPFGGATRSASVLSRAAHAEPPGSINRDKRARLKSKWTNVDTSPVSRLLLTTLACALGLLVIAAPASAAADPWPGLFAVGGPRQVQGDRMIISINGTAPGADLPRYIKVSSSPRVGLDGALADEDVVEVFPFIEPPEYWNDPVGTAKGLWNWIPGSWYWQPVDDSGLVPRVGPVRRVKVLADRRMDARDGERYEKHVLAQSGPARRVYVLEEGEYHGNQYLTQFAWIAERYVYKGRIRTGYRFADGERRWHGNFKGSRARLSCIAKGKPYSKCSKPFSGLKAGGPGPVKVPKGVQTRPIRYR